MTHAVFAADLGGTNIRLAAVSPAGEILHSTKRKTPRGVRPEQFIALLTHMSGECRTALTDVEFTAIGFGAPANVASDGVLHHLPNIPTLEGFDLQDGLRTAFGLPVALENDATAACIGEAWLGASKGVENSILVTLGTGMGGGLIVNGEVLRGPDGGAGKIGHICVEPEGHPCGCGSHGCIEQYASARALVRMAGEVGLTVPHSYALYKAREQGNSSAAAVFRRMGTYLGITLAGMVNTLNPDLIVIGGGVAAGIDAFLEPLVSELKRRAFSEPAERAMVVKSELGDNAGLIGAARSALDIALRR